MDILNDDKKDTTIIKEKIQELEKEPYDIIKYKQDPAKKYKTKSIKDLSYSLYVDTNIKKKIISV